MPQSRVPARFRWQPREASALQAIAAADDEGGATEETVAKLVGLIDDLPIDLAALRAAVRTLKALDLVDEQSGTFRLRPEVAAAAPRTAKQRISTQSERWHRFARRVLAPPSSYDLVRRLAKDLPNVQEGPSRGAPAVSVRGKLFAFIHEDGESIAVRTNSLERAYLLRAGPDTFFITARYRRQPWVLVRLSRIPPAGLRLLLDIAWGHAAPKSLRDASPEIASA